MIYSIFKDKVERFPELIAFVLEDGREFTYAQAEVVVDQFAEHLIGLGIKQGDRVGVMLEFESFHPFVFYALDKLNASYVPFDVNTPKMQLEMDVKKLGLSAFIDDTTPLIQRLNQMQTGPFKGAECSAYPLSQMGLASRATPGKTEGFHPTYIVSSSGTSGNKKWMGIPGAGLGYWEKTEEKILQLKPGHKVLCTRSPGYDARISEYLRALTAGGTLHLISRHERKDLDFIIQYCEKHQITTLLMIASQLAGDDLEAKIQRLAKAALTNLIVTGDACSPFLKSLCEKYGISLINAYGPTEACFGISVLAVNGLSLIDGAVPIGLPLSEEIKLHIIDEELWIESPYMCEGYLDNPEKTAEFFQTKESKKLFRTGDRIEIKNNYLLYKGRLENSQDSKIIGVKVDAYSVEKLIQDYSDQIQVCVVSKKIDDRTKLMAYLVTKPDFDTKQFVDYLQGWLKAEEMPLLMSINALPVMTVSDKIDRQALRARDDLPSDYLLARNSASQPSLKTHDNEIIQKLEIIWEEVLKIKPQSHDDNFIFLGGDSLFAMRLLKKIQQQIDPKFTHRDLFTLEVITINAIYQKLTQKPTEDNQPIAIISPLTHPERKGKPYVFMLPPLLGDGRYSLFKLAESFASDHQVNMIGLSDPGVYDKTKIPKTMEEAVTRYVNAILQVQPKGSYKLMGFSYGCTLAYHVAAKLEAMGHFVGWLHLVDGFSPLFYQKLTNEQHAGLLNDFQKFIIETLGNEFYNDPIKANDLSSIRYNDKESQINTLINPLIKQVKNEISCCLLEVVRNHLLFLLDTTPPAKVCAYLTRFYLSKPGQNYVSLIDGIPGLSSDSLDHTYYYWNRYFDKIRRCERIANSDHLSLLTNKESTKVFFQYSPATIRYMPFIFEHSIVRAQPYLIQNETDYTLMICNLSYDDCKAFDNELIGLNLLSEIVSFRQDIKYYNTRAPNDSLYEERYVLLARFHNSNLNQINQFIDKHINKEEYKDKSPLIKLSKKQSIIDTHETIDNDKSCTAPLKIILYFQDTLPIEFRFDPITINTALLQTIMKTSLSKWIKIQQRNNYLLLTFKFDHTASGYLLSTVTVGSCMATLLPIIMPYRLNEYQKSQQDSSQIDPSIEDEKLSQIIASFKKTSTMMTDKKKCSII